MRLTGHGFEGESLHSEATIGDIITLLSEAPNKRTMTADAGAFLEHVMLCNADDISLAMHATYGAGGMATEAIQRVLLRANWRTTIAIELAGRMRDAAGGAS